MKYRLYFSFSLLSTIYCSAQLRLLPIQHLNPNSGASHQRLTEVKSIVLPFWDDFSQSQGIIDTTWWMPSSQVSVVASPGNGVNPPTLNVVTFDGVNAQGIPYSPISSEGLVDSLVSKPIDLTKVPLSLRNTVYLSFFYQIKGLGESPESSDSLLLYFRHRNGTWEKVWPLAGDPRPTDPSKFNEKLIQVADTSYFHPKFQFKFQAIGRQNGMFDNWNIDYIYMDKRRNANDNSFLDRAFTGIPSSIFGEYTALPMNEFRSISNKSAILSGPVTHIMNLEQDIQPIDYEAVLRDTLKKVDLEKLATTNGVILFPRDMLETMAAAPDSTSFDTNADSLFLEIKYSVNSGDKFLIDSIFNGGQDTVFYDNIDLKVNDTVRAYFSLHDYYAYDDGTAEFGAGINQKNGKLAYQFVTHSQSFIDRVDLYFPNIDRNQAGSPLELFVLADLNEDKNSVLGRLNASVQFNGINKFVSYSFNPSIQVQDTFYVGYTNLNDDGVWLATGLDKNTDTSDRIFLNVDGSWVSNTTVTGSLMIRPHVSNGIVSGIKKNELPKVSVFPNPSPGELFISGKIDVVRAYDVMGKKIKFTQNIESGRRHLTFPYLGARLILLEMISGRSRQVQRIMLTR